MNNGRDHKMGFRYATLWVMLIFWAVGPAWGFTEGKTYDKSNVQEIAEMLVPQVLTYVQNEGWVITTGKLNFDMKWDDAFLEQSKKNEGK